MGENNNNVTLFIQFKDGSTHKLENCSVSLQNKPDVLTTIWNKIKAVIGLKTQNKAYQFTGKTYSWNLTAENMEFR